MKKNIILNLAINLMTCIGLLGVIYCSAIEGSNEDRKTRPPYVATLMNDLIGSYTPTNGATVSILGEDIILDTSTVIESKLNNNKYVFNINNLSGTIKQIEFTEDKVVYIGSDKYTQEFIYKTPNSATLQNAYITFDSGKGNTSLDIAFDTVSKKLTLEGMEIATKQ